MKKTLTLPTGEKIVKEFPGALPYKNYGEFLEQFLIGQSTIEVRKTLKVSIAGPCLVCRTRGSVWDPNDPRDCYEGNKLRRRIKCDACRGTGIGPKKTRGRSV